MSSKRSFKLMGILWIVMVSVGLVGVVATYALEQEKGDKPMDTELLGGMTTLMPEGLAGMQKLQKVPFLQDYILHARGGKLTKVAVEKSRLPHDPKGHIQGVSMALGPAGTVYVNQMTILCKSTDGGRTWTSREREWPWPGEESAEWETMGFFQVLDDGTFITVMGSGVRTDPVAVWASSDEGETWRRISQIELPVQYNERYLSGLFRLPDDTLLARIQGRNAKYQDDDFTKWLSGKTTLLLYRSMDKGRSWQGPSTMCDWGSEGGIVQTASGKLLATIRHQRPPLPDDPPDLLEKTGASVFGVRYPYKHVFVADSEDEGLTWKNFRQLTTVFGQCYGFPAALSDGTVVVVHDHRYPRGLPGRAMISYDEGQTWEDEVYYMYYASSESGYSQTVVLEDDVILTVAGTLSNGRTEFTAIRWKPVRD